MGYLVCPRSLAALGCLAAPVLAVWFILDGSTFGLAVVFGLWLLIATLFNEYVLSRLNNGRVIRARVSRAVRGQGRMTVFEISSVETGRKFTVRPMLYAPDKLDSSWRVGEDVYALVDESINEAYPIPPAWIARLACTEERRAAIDASRRNVN
jgi:hypothetical protein